MYWQNKFSVHFLPPLVTPKIRIKHQTGSLLCYKTWWEKNLTTAQGLPWTSPQKHHNKTTKTTAWQFFVTFLGWWKRDPSNWWNVTNPTFGDKKVTAAESPGGRESQQNGGLLSCSALEVIFYRQPKTGTWTSQKPVEMASLNVSWLIMFPMTDPCNYGIFTY